MEEKGGVARRKHKALEKERFRFSRLFCEAQFDINSCISGKRIVIPTVDLNKEILRSPVSDSLRR